MPHVVRHVKHLVFIHRAQSWRSSFNKMAFLPVLTHRILPIYVSLHQLGTAPIKTKWKQYKTNCRTPPTRKQLSRISVPKKHLWIISPCLYLTRFCHKSKSGTLSCSQATKKDGCNHSKLRIDGRITKGPDAKSCMYTPWKMNGRNLRIRAPWKRKIIWTKPSFSGSSR